MRINDTTTRVLSWAIPPMLVVAVLLGAFAINALIAEAQETNDEPTVEEVVRAGGCDVFADMEAAVDHFREEGDLESVPHTWDNRPPAFRGDSLDAGVSVTVAGSDTHHGFSRARTVVVDSEATYNRARANLLYAVGNAAVVDARFGFSPHADVSSDKVLSGEIFKGADFRHVLVPRDTEGNPKMPICWHYYSDADGNLPPPTPTPTASPEPTAEPADETESTSGE